MRYSLLDCLACPVCLASLTCVTGTEIPSPMPVGRSSTGSRVSSGPGIGPPPAVAVTSPLTDLLAQLASRPASAERGDQVEVESGLLVCECGRWFPIERSIPELLPDELRNSTRDSTFLDDVSPSIPASLANALRQFRPSDAPAAPEEGRRHKEAEIGISSKVDDASFFAPGYSSPFAYWDPDFSVYLLKLFGAVAPLLRLSRNDRVVDSGCGYAWTTEWLFRSGFDPIGVDICRTYLEVGLERMGVPRPHLVIGDVEALPLRSAAAKAVLAYESFHHIPNRPRAMRAYERVLEDRGVVILAEPGAAHEHAPVAIDAMQKYGILEKGMELADVRGYVDGTTLNAEQVFLLRMAHGEVGALVDTGFVTNHSVVEGNLFRLVKGGAPTAAASPPELRQHLVNRVRARITRILNS
jgi:uncharacterized protein YbaR (Trm112 family)/SAM-dependent methyltransferase